jgi:hypothetical protein
VDAGMLFNKRRREMVFPFIRKESIKVAEPSNSEKGLITNVFVMIEDDLGAKFRGGFGYVTNRDK